MNIADVLDQKQLIDYTKALPDDDSGLSALFPTKKINDFEADYILGAQSRPVSAQIYAFDTPTELGQRDGFQRGTVGLELIKEKMRLDEREIMRLNRPRSDAEAREIVNNLYNDVKAVKDRIDVRIERMRYDALCEGVIDIKEENGYTTKLDFGVPSNHKVTLNWSDPTHDIIGDIIDFCDQIEQDTGGIKLSKIMIAKKWLRQILKNEKLRRTIFGTLEQDKYFSVGMLNEELQRQGLPTIYTNDRMYAVEKINGRTKRRELQYVRYFDEDRLVAVPDGIMGHTLRGLTPEGEGLRNSGIANIEMAGETVITYYQDVDPVAHYVKGSATAAVTFPYADQVIHGTLN